MKRQCRKPGFLGHFVKSAVAIVAMKEQRFLEAGAGVNRVDLRIDVAIGDENIEPSIIVHIKERGSPSDVRIAGLAYTGGPTDVVEAFLAPVTIERIRLLLEMSDEKAQAAAVVIVPPINAHVAEFHALAAERDAGQHTHIGERPVVIVMVQIVWNGIVGYKEIGPAIVIVVYPHYSQAIVANFIVDPSPHRDFFEGSITAIVIQEIALAFETPRA